MDISVIVTFHREGLLARPTLETIRRACLSAASTGISTECLLVCDNTDSVTESIIEQFLLENDLPWRCIRVLNSDLGQSRNDGIRQATGRFVAIFDGDDYMAPDWLTTCYEMASKYPSGDIFHPEFVLTFDRSYEVIRQISQLSPEFDPDMLFAVNLWNSCSFSSRGTYLSIPYADAKGRDSGFGYEDWHWNCETIARGHRHLIVPDTVHFVRRKIVDSLSTTQSMSFSVIGPTQFLGDNRS